MAEQVQGAGQWAGPKQEASQQPGHRFKQDPDYHASAGIYTYLPASTLDIYNIYTYLPTSTLDIYNIYTYLPASTLDIYNIYTHLPTFTLDIYNIYTYLPTSTLGIYTIYTYLLASTLGIYTIYTGAGQGAGGGKGDCFAVSKADLALATVPGMEFDPAKRFFTAEELKPQPIIKKRKKVTLLSRFL